MDFLKRLVSYDGIEQLAEAAFRIAVVIACVGSLIVVTGVTFSGGQIDRLIVPLAIACFSIVVLVLRSGESGNQPVEDEEASQ